MIVATKIGDRFTVQASIVPPAIYLDHWALRAFSSDPQLSARLISILNQKGTLLFSWANIAEIAGNQGKNLAEFEEFLRAVGSRWFPLQATPNIVIENESSTTPDGNLPYFDTQLLKSYTPHVFPDDITLD